MRHIFNKINDIRKGLRFASIFTFAYYCIGSAGIVMVNYFLSLFLSSYQQYTHFDLDGWLFLFISGIILFYISLRFIYRDREYIETLKQNKEQLNMYKIIFEHMNEGLIITDPQKKILDINPSFEKTTGYQKEDVLGKDPNVLNSGMHSKEFYKTMWNKVVRMGIWQGEIINKKKNGELFPEELSITAIKNQENETINYIGIFRDITAKLKSQEQIEFLTHYDSLTRLPKHPLFMKKLAYVMEQHVPFSLFIIEIRKLKALNATHGYKLGDEVIQKIAIRLQNLYKGMPLARVNSKDFAIIVTDITMAEKAIETAQIILYEIEKSILLQEEEFFVTANIGLCLYPFHGNSVDEIYQNADAAKAFAKDKDIPYRLFNEQLKQDISKKVALESDLMKALEKNELRIYFQPQINLNTNKLEGFEALLRWEHPKFGLLSPRTFIPIAEENGQIIPISEWIIKNVCEQQKDWQEQGLPLIKTAINISAKHFQSSKLIKKTAEYLKETQINPAGIEFEITESISMLPTKRLIQTLHDLKSLGIVLSIDDFGTGHSSLSYLQQLPIDFLKIDRAFLIDIPNNKRNMSITRAIIAIAHELNLSVIAEGIENEEQLNFLLESGCDYAQGYYFDKPMPKNVIHERIVESYEISS